MQTAEIERFKVVYEMGKDQLNENEELLGELHLDPSCTDLEAEFQVAEDVFMAFTVTQAVLREKQPHEEESFLRTEIIDLFCDALSPTLRELVDHCFG